MGILKEWNQEWKNGLVDKWTHGPRMYAEYVKLLDYRDLLNDSWAKSIVIDRDSVIIEIERKVQTDKQTNVQLRLPLFETDGGIAISMLTNGSYEAAELSIVDCLLDYLEHSAVAMDIGANYGWYSLNIARQRPDMQVYAFEPIPRTFQRLNKNKNINHISNITAFNIGLSSEEADVDFYFDVVASGASSMRDLREVETTVKQTCRVRRLDNVVRELGLERIDFIKCDVEGSELLVYRGGVESINKFQPIIFSEMLRKWSAKFGYHPNDIIKLLRDMGYECFVVGESSVLKPFGLVDEKTVETNYFFLHKERHAGIIDNVLKSNRNGL